MSRNWMFMVPLVAGSQLLLLAACASIGNKNSSKVDPTSTFEIINNDFQAETEPESLPPREPSACPGLDSQLYQLIQTENPPKTASEIGLIVKNGKIQVLFILVSEDSDFLLDYEIELGTQSGNQVQAYVPFDRLCELANLDAVLAIRPVDRIYQ